MHGASKADTEHHSNNLSINQCGWTLYWSLMDETRAAAAGAGATDDDVDDDGSDDAADVVSMANGRPKCDTRS